MIIFAVIHNDSGRMYVGYSLTGNLNSFGTGKYIRQAIKKFGINSFSKKILEKFNNDEPLINVMSRVEHWIKKFKSDDPEYGYNETIEETIPRKKKLTRKIQVLLTPEDEDNLNQIIIEGAMKHNLKPLTISKYVRQLIINHIVEETAIENTIN